MNVVTESTMAIDTTFNSIINEIQLSKLNFGIQLTPFAAYITLKKSTQVDKNGVHAAPSPPLFSILQQSYHDLRAAQEENLCLRNALKACEQKCEDLTMVNSSLFKKLEAVDLDVNASREVNDSLCLRLDSTEKEVSKLRQLNKDLEDKVKLHSKEYSAYTFDTNAKIKALTKEIGGKDKENYNLNKTIANQRDTVTNLKDEVSKMKIRATKAEKENKKMEKKLVKLEAKREKQSRSSQTVSCIDTPYSISEPLPPIFGSQVCTQSKSIFLSRSLPDISKVALVNITADDILQEAAEEALNAQYDEEINVFYEEARQKARKIRELYDENAIGELFGPNSI